MTDENDQYTDDDYETAIAHALRAHDMKAVTELLAALAVRNPSRAQSVIDTIQLGLAALDARKGRA